MTDQPLRPVPMPTDPTDCVQVVVPVASLRVLRALAAVAGMTLGGPFQINDEDLPTLFLWPKQAVRTETDT